jgi:hypothetical protein
MGAELITATLVIDHDRTPEWEAMRAFIRARTPDQLETDDLDTYGDWLWGAREHSDGVFYVENPSERVGPFPRDDAEADAERRNREEQAQAYRDALLGYVDELERAWGAEYRQSFIFRVRTADVFITGGTSWGDDPCEEFTAAIALDKIEGLLPAGGFDGWSS